MKARTIHILTFIMCSISVAHAENWPQWRGPSLNGVSTEKNLPAKWTTQYIRDQS